MGDLRELVSAQERQAPPVPQISLIPKNIVVRVVLHRAAAQPDDFPLLRIQPCRRAYTQVSAYHQESIHIFRCRFTRSSRLSESACGTRSEEHTSELQSLMRTSYAVFCLKK